MQTLRLILLFLHLIGFAMLLGGSIAQYLTGKLRINPAMLWGSVVQVVTGLALAAPLRGGGDHEPPTAKLAVKLVIGLMIFVMAFFPRKREQVARGHFLALVGLTVGNAAVAVFWR
ncbi:hypothetical protein [Dactylosporangium sp. CA-092794]|uniref:hypothetical protein n=1 Tax=Dactylosporangium sp. CA-092794 TaxID=3239929 RepID=UPI003D8C0BF9